MNGPSALQSSFNINSLLEVLHQFIKRKESQEKCPIHDQPIKLYCKYCHELICSECAIDKHRNHACVDIDKAYEEKQQLIEEHVGMLKKKKDEFNNAIEGFTDQEARVTNYLLTTKTQIDLAAEEAMKRITECHKELLATADNVATRKIEFIAMQRKMAENIVHQFKGFEELIASNLKEWGPGKVVRDDSSIIKSIDSMSMLHDVEVFQPIEDASLQFNPTTKLTDLMFGALEYSSYDHQKVLIKRGFVGEQNTITLMLKDDKGKPHPVPPSTIKAIISPPLKRHQIDCNAATQICPGVYEMYFTSTNRGEHIANVFVGGIQIQGSPFTIKILARTNSLGGNVDMTFGLKSPWGIGIYDDGEIIVVAENGSNSLTLLGEDGKCKGRLAVDGLLCRPRGVAISIDGNILVTDDHRVTMVTLEGTVLATFGNRQPGNTLSSLNYPVGITVDHKTGNVFVADSKNDRIIVLDRHLSYQYTFSNILSEPSDIAFDKNGYMYVTLLQNHCVKIFSPNGTPNGVIGSRGRRPGHLMNPIALAIGNNELYICENGNNRISVFNLDKQFLHFFEERGSGLLSIAITHNAYIYVSDYNNGRVIIY